VIILNLDVDGKTGRSTEQKFDGVNYQIEVFWSDTERIWVASLFDADREPLPIQGRALRHGADLLRSLSDPRLPDGALVCWDTSNRQQDPGRNDLDSDGAVRLMYVTAAEKLEAGVVS